MDAFGVYVHIPFCARRCDYCAFATWDGHVPAGQHLREPLHAVDWFPTLVRLAGGGDVSCTPSNAHSGDM